MVSVTRSIVHIIAIQIYRVGSLSRKESLKNVCNAVLRTIPTTNPIEWIRSKLPNLDSRKFGLGRHDCRVWARYLNPTANIASMLDRMIT